MEPVQTKHNMSSSQNFLIMKEQMNSVFTDGGIWNQNH